MKPHIFLLAGLLATFVSQAPAQTTSLQALKAARDFRQELALSVGQGAQTPGKALALLRSSKGASGRAASAEADFAYAVLDVGYRLIALERPDAAEEFFRAAEQGLQVEANRAGQAREKAELLRHLATVRGRFLGKIDQAKADIDEAVRLQPSDMSLQEARAALARGHGETFKNSGKN